MSAWKREFHSYILAEELNDTQWYSHNYDFFLRDYHLFNFLHVFEHIAIQLRNNDEIKLQ